MLMKSDNDKFEKLLGIAERNPKSALAEGYRRTCNMFDNYNFVYTSVSSGKDSLFMSQISILELQRRQDAIREKAMGTTLSDRVSQIRKAGIATQYEDDLQHFSKFLCGEDPIKTKIRYDKFTNFDLPEGITDIEKEMGEDDPRELKERFLWNLKCDLEHPELAVNHRIGMLVMEYEMSFDQSDEVLRRVAKEFATDIRLIEPDGKIDLEKSVKENGYDLSWISDNPLENPHRKSRKEIERMRPYELANIYGKAVVFLFDMMQSIAWENSSGVDNSRYISFDPNCENIWVKRPPVEQDPHKEWLITNQNLYESHYGLSPMFEILPAMSDQVLRVEFSKYISRAIPEALEAGWPAKKFDEATGTYI